MCTGSLRIPDISSPRSKLRGSNNPDKRYRRKAPVIMLWHLLVSWRMARRGRRRKREGREHSEGWPGPNLYSSISSLPSSSTLCSSSETPIALYCHLFPQVFHPAFWSYGHGNNKIETTEVRPPSRPKVILRKTSGVAH
jgi:hypothetical protein